jgi:hypothetical protein
VDQLLQRQFPWGRYNAELPELVYSILHAQATMRCCIDELALLNLEVVHAWGMAEQRCTALSDFMSLSSGCVRYYALYVSAVVRFDS